MPEANVDFAELHKFEALAARWWDPESEFKPLHAINPLRLGFIDQRCPLAGREVLDVGCGGGILTEAMAKRGARVTGIDLGDAPLAVARLHALEHGIDATYRRVAAEQLAQETPQTYDIVTCMELLEHVPDPASTVRACATLVKPGGAVFFSTINRNPKSFLFAVVGAEYVLKLLPRGTHRYEKFIRPSELNNCCNSARLRVREMTGMHYSPLRDHYWLATGLDVNYLVHAEREIDA